MSQDMIARVPLFSELTEDELSLVSSVAVRREYDRQTTVFFEYEAGDALYIIEMGQVRIYRVAEDGREKTLTLLSDGDYFGEMALLDEEPRSAIAETTEKSVLHVIHKRDFEKVFMSYPQIGASIIRELCRRLRQTNKQLMDAVFLDVRTRLLSLLTQLDEKYGRNYENGRLIDIKLTHQQIANMVGTSRESVTRVLTELQDLGVLTYVEHRLMWIDPVLLAGSSEVAAT